MTPKTYAGSTAQPREPGRLLLDVVDAGNLLGVSKWTMYELMHHGILPSVKIQSRRFIARDDLDAYVERLRTEAGERHGL